MFHIYFKIHEWFCTLKTMNGRSLWINSLFSRPNGLTRCIFFHSFHSWKNMQLVSPFGLSKRPFIHMDRLFIVFFVQSFIFFIMNVEKEHSFKLHDELICIIFAKAFWGVNGNLITNSGPTFAEICAWTSITYVLGACVSKYWSQFFEVQKNSI